MAAAGGPAGGRGTTAKGALGEIGDRELQNRVFFSEVQSWDSLFKTHQRPKESPNIFTINTLGKKGGAGGPSGGDSNSDDDGEENTRAGGLAVFRRDGSVAPL